MTRWRYIIVVVARTRRKIDKRCQHNWDKKKRNDNVKTMRNLRAKMILIIELYEFKVKILINVFDQLIETTRVACINNIFITFKLISTIKKLKKITTQLKQILKKKHKKKQYLSDDRATRCHDNQINHRHK